MIKLLILQNGTKIAKISYLVNPFKKPAFIRHKSLEGEEEKVPNKLTDGSFNMLAQNFVIFLAIFFFCDFFHFSLMS